ncbi:hypothetical protein BC830DRAFT_600782 [Chytriomyces sp. MP71]|nr:hypothetical protein BC830DRAFT_600782 [Chytriomyces sp. MP71]
MLGFATFAKLFARRSGDFSRFVAWFVLEPGECKCLTSPLCRFMRLSVLATIAELASVYTGFFTLSTNCPFDALEGVQIVTEQCVWSAVYQFHGVYLAFVHIMFAVLMNCCVYDCMKVCAHIGRVSIFFKLYMSGPQ